MKVPLTVGDYLRRGAAVYGGRTAVHDEPGTAGSFGSLTYSELESRARGMALALEQLGVGLGERVAIVSPNAARFLISYLRRQRLRPGAGARQLPARTPTRSATSSATPAASVLLVDPESEPDLRDISVKHKIVLDGTADADLFAPAPEGAEPAELGASTRYATASINYTSGTTARPKGVQLTHRNCWLNAATFGWHTAVTDRDVFLHTLPMFHCNGWGMPYAVTGMGVPQVVIRKIDGEEILRRIEAHGVTLMCGAPAVVAAILHRRGRAAGRGPGDTPAPGRCGSSSRARRRRRRPSSGSRRSWAGSSSRSTA